IPMGCGSAMAIKMQNISDKVVFVVIGDGATNEGSFHECLNMASLWNLPVVIVCINNDYGVSTKQAHCCSEPSLVKRAESYNIYADECDGNDVLSVIDSVKKARWYALKNGPAFVELKTYRTCGHSRSDKNLYRTNDEIMSWEEKCPLKTFETKLINDFGYTEKRLSEIKSHAEEQTLLAVEYAKNSDYPSIDETLDLVY
ncbi:MAG: thiamine pyrophosphate-dependent dehydrogenase E1 component subunit alpha, partial [Oscillospiraceae bacterium]